MFILPQNTCYYCGDKKFFDQTYNVVVNIKRKIDLLVADKVVVEAAKAIARTIVNTAIAVVDVVPAFGEIFSWGADVVKALDRARRLHRAKKEGKELKKIPPSVFDLTPDVGVSVAVLTEIIEPFTSGTAPSHAIEGLMQLYFDWPRIKSGINKALEILKVRC